MKKTLTKYYLLQQMAYNATSAGIISFATAFLLEKGFLVSQVGILLAAGNLLSCAMQPFLAERADRIGGNVLTRLVRGLALLGILSFGTLQLLPIPRWLFGLLYLLGVFTFDAMMPLLNSICVFYERRGYSINYGFSRGMGSFAYSVAALGIGKVIADFGADWMIWIVLVLFAIIILMTFCYPRINITEALEIQKQDCCSLMEFFSCYRWYCVSLLGVMLLAMFHAMTENYLIEVIGVLGGDSSNVGMALFIATLVEMPVLMFFDQIRRYISINMLLKLAGVSFLLKAVLLLIAPSVASIYIIQLLQATSYGFLSPTQLYYANNKIAQADMVKGQAFITASYTLGCAIGNFTGGQLLEVFNVTALLIAGVAMAAAGTLILCVTVDRKSINETM